VLHNLFHDVSKILVIQKKRGRNEKFGGTVKKQTNRLTCASQKHKGETLKEVGECRDEEKE